VVDSPPVNFRRHAGQAARSRSAGRDAPQAVDLSVSVGTVSLRNPVIAASGTFGYGVEFAELVDLNRLGGLVVKGLSREPMEGAPLPRLCETPGGMLNAIGQQNIGVRAFVREKLPELCRSLRVGADGFATAVVANVFGYRVEDYVEVIRVLEDAEGLTAYELNISCPNTSRGGLEYGTDPAATGEVVAAARRAAVRRPLWVKLSPNVTDITAIARAAEQAGADALTVANTWVGMAVDVETRRSRLGRLTGGLSGPAIKPLTLRLVYQVAQAVRIPVLGVGGIQKPEDVVEYLLVGAHAVQVGTAHFLDPRASVQLVEGLENLCFRRSINRIRDLRGALLPKSVD
jgi:dihydroorotate dehydrogenase (NAD+) catalytic subunit